MAATVVAWAPTSATNSGSSNVASWSGTATSLTPTIATSFSLQANDVLVLVASADGAQTLSITQGWTPTVAASALPSGSCYVWWKRTTGTETNPTISGATGSICLQAIQIRGAPPSVTRWSNLNYTTGTGTSMSAAAQVASAPDTLLIQAFASARNNTVSTCSLGSFTYHNTSAGLDTMCGFAWGTQALPGTTGTPTVTQSRSDAWISALFRFDYPIEIGETATPDDTDSYAIERAGVKEALLPGSETTTQAGDGYRTAYVGSVRGVELPGAQSSTTPIDAVRGPTGRGATGLSESATPQDGVAIGDRRLTQTPFIRSLSASTITIGDSFTVNGDQGWNIAASATATTDQAAAVARFGVVASESVNADDAARDGGAAHAVSTIAESADATDRYDRGDSGEGRVITESATAEADQAGAVATFGVSADESAAAQDSALDGGATHARGLSESATAEDGYRRQDTQKTATPILTSLSDSSITIGESFTVNGNDGTGVAESAGAAVALDCNQAFACTLTEALAAADNYVIPLKTPTPYLTSLSDSSITVGDSFIVNGVPTAGAITAATDAAVSLDCTQVFACTLEEALAVADGYGPSDQKTPTPVLTSLSKSSIAVGDSFIVNGLPAIQDGIGELTLPQDLYGANQAFLNEITESTTPSDTYRLPNLGLVIPTTLEAWEADLYTAELEGDDALLQPGEYIEWLVDPGAGGIFTFEGTLSSMEGGKIVVSVNGIDQPTIYVSSEEEEEERA